MTPFNYTKELLTIGEALEPAMKITEQEDADQYFKKYVDYLDFWLQKDPRIDGKTPEDIARINLGYFAGYYGYETMDRVNRLFKTKHPVIS